MILKILTFLLIFCASFSTKAQLPRLVPIETKESGIGSWQSMPFGKMRLLSCTTGVQDLPMVVGGLQVQLNSDWVMNKPTLKPLTDVYPAWIENPVAPGDGRNPRYKGEVLFPLVYYRSPKEADFELGVQGNLPVCQGQKCITLPFRIGLMLKGNEADYTAACPYLIERQRQAPLPAEAMGVQGFAWRQGDEVQMMFSGVKNANVAFLQTTAQMPFQVYETQMEKNGVYMRIKTLPWETGKHQDWILITDQGILKVPVQMVSDAVILPAPPTSKMVWILGWELFFLTPLFIWWGLGCTKTNKKWKQEILSLMLLLPAVLILKVLFSAFYPLDIPGYAVILLALVCLFPPVRKISALGLFLIWPYCPQIPEMGMPELMLWLIIITLEVELPFVLLYIKADEIGRFLRDLKKKHFFICNFIFLVPTLFLLGGFICQVLQKKVVFFNELNPNGLSVLCSPKEQSSWKKEAHFIKPDSVLGESLQKMYQRHTVVIWQDKNGRLILAPDISPKKASEAILNWKSYHAAGRP